VPQANGREFGARTFKVRAFAFTHGMKMDAVITLGPPRKIDYQQQALIEF
jgi:hypothetical protein